MTQIQRLSIYDSADKMIRGIGTGRDAAAKIAADSVANVRSGLDGLVAGGQRFNRVVFDTHGSEGQIVFGKDGFGPITWRTMFAGRGYERLFPFFSKMYFSGCNVSDTGEGWNFLEAASDVFFRSHGGVTMAYTSLGFSTRWGHVDPKHLWGEIRLVVSMPGKKPRRVSGGDFLQIVMGGDHELLMILKRVDIL